MRWLPVIAFLLVPAATQKRPVSAGTPEGARVTNRDSIAGTVAAEVAIPFVTNWTRDHTHKEVLDVTQKTQHNADSCGAWI